MFDFDNDGSVTHKESLVGFLLTGLGAIIMLISATTTFGFFSRFFGNFVDARYVGTMYASVISGLIGVILFDVCCVIFLYVYLYKAETPEQRAIALTNSGLMFLCSAIASMAHIYLSAATEMELDMATLATIRNVATFTVLFGVTANFSTYMLYTRFSYGSKQRVKESNRRDMVQKAEDAQAAFLDQLVTQKVKEKLESQADELAMLQARRIADAFGKRERAKYHDGSKQLPPPQPEPKREYTRADRENFTNGQRTRANGR